jgi:4-amino-4-deoxy-L-arabinose transferase-like glycosyltransferase
MVISLPVENQPLTIAVISVLLMLMFAIWLGRQIFLGLGLLWHTPATHLATLTLLSFSGWVLLEFFAIVYLFNKDITIVPRYNFVYYPSFCALIAASLNRVTNYKLRSQKQINIFLIVGVLSSIFVVSNLVFEKPLSQSKLLIISTKILLYL